MRTLKLLLVWVCTILFLNANSTNSKLSFLSYYDASNARPFVKLDRNGSIYTITSNPLGLIVRAFDEDKKLIWEKSIVPNQNTLKTILQRKGADFNNLIDINLLGIGASEERRLDSGDIYKVNIPTTCGSTDASGQFQLDNAIITHDVKIEGDYLYILGRTCDPNFKVVNGSYFKYVYYYKINEYTKSNNQKFYEYIKTFELNKQIILFKLSLKDGTINYSSYFGAYSDDEARAFDIDQNGSIYITGYTSYFNPNDGTPYSGETYKDSTIPQFSASKLIYSSPTLKTASNSSLCSHKNYINPFVLKLTPNSNSYSLSKIHIFGSYCIDRAFDIAVDNSNVYIAGETYAGGDDDFIHFDVGGITNVAPTRNIANPSNSGSDIFITHLDKNLIGKQVRLFGSSGNDDVFGGIDIDKNRSVYLVGNTTDLNMPIYNNKFSIPISGSCYVMKFKPYSLKREFATYIDQNVGVENQTGGVCNDMAVSSDGKVYITGGANLVMDGVAFLYVMDGSNQNTLHIEKISGSDIDNALSVDVDKLGNAIFAGQTQSTDLNEINPINSFNQIDTQNGNSFIAKVVLAKNTTTKTDDGKEINATLNNGRIEDIKLIKNYPTPPKNVKVTYAIAFKAYLDSGKSEIEITLDFPSKLPSNAKIYKIVNNSYIDITNKVTINGNKVTFKVKDNSQYDTNTQNGIIEDPLVVAQNGNSSNSNNSNNSNNNNSNNNSNDNTINKNSGGGGGCSYNPNAKSVDFMILLMVILSIIYLLLNFYEPKFYKYKTTKMEKIKNDT